MRSSRWARIAGITVLTLAGVTLGLVADRVLAETTVLAPIAFATGAMAIPVALAGTRAAAGIVLAVPVIMVLSPHESLPDALAHGAGLVLGAVAMGALLRRLQTRMRKPVDPTIVLTTALAAGAAAGLGTVVATGFRTGSGQILVTTAAALALGATLLVPVGLAVRRRLVRHRAEFVVVMIVAATVTVALAAGRVDEVAPGFVAWLLLPLLLAVGVRYGVFAAALSTLVWVTLILWLVARESPLEPSSLLQRQAVAAVLALVVLTMVVLVKQQRASAARERASEEVLGAFLDHADSMWYLKVVPTEPDVAPTYLRIGGGPFRDHDHAQPVTDEEIFGAEAAPAVVAADRDVARTGESTTIVERLTIPSGQPWTTLSSRFPVTDDAGRIIAVGGIRTDITEREQLAELREQQNQLLRAMFVRSPMPSLRAYLDDAGAVRVAAANDAFGHVIGRDPGGLTGVEVRSLVLTEDWPAVAGLLRPVPTLRHTDRWNPQAEVRIHTRIGQHRLALVTVAPLDAPSAHEREFLLHVEDVTARRAAEEAVAWYSLFDTVTGLMNRAALGDRLDAALHRIDAGSTGVALITLDVDDFKSINDSHGHGAGDLILVEYGSRIRRVCDTKDSVARLSADEFAIVVEWEVQESVAVFVGRLQSALAEPVQIGDGPLYATTSFGVALTKDPAVGAGELVRQAELALFRAKRLGRGRVEFYAESMRAQAQAVLNVRNELTSAVASDGFLVAYQPIVSLDDGTVVGFEALVRLPTRDGRILAPGEFLDVARSADLVTQIDRLVLREALADLAGNRLPVARTGLSVNVEPDDLRDPNFAMDVLTQLHAFSVAPELLTAEVTEAALLSYDETVADNVASLRDAGVQFAIDDFGTGYSSLAQLRRLDVDVIKIDRSFVSAMEHDAEDANIVATVIGLAHRLGLVAVAEGIETREQAEALQRLGCDRGQGFLFGHPQPIARSMRRTPVSQPADPASGRD